MTTLLRCWPADRLVVGDDHVARLEAGLAVALEPVGDDSTPRSATKCDTPADILARSARPPRPTRRGAEVAHLVDHHVVGGCRCRSAAIPRLADPPAGAFADDLEGDRVRARSCASPSSRPSDPDDHSRPDGAIVSASPPNSTVVVPCSWISARTRNAASGAEVLAPEKPDKAIGVGIVEVNLARLAAGLGASLSAQGTEM